MSSRMRWRSSLLMPCCLPGPKPFWSRSPRCANAGAAATSRERMTMKRRIPEGMLPGPPCTRVSARSIFVTIRCSMAELKTRILVVDDDQRLRDLLVRYLSGEGYEVKAVPDEIGRAHV